MDPFVSETATSARSYGNEQPPQAEFRRPQSYRGQHSHSEHLQNFSESSNIDLEHFSQVRLPMPNWCPGLHFKSKEHSLSIRVIKHAEVLVGEGETDGSKFYLAVQRQWNRMWHCQKNTWDTSLTRKAGQRNSWLSVGDWLGFFTQKGWEIHKAK